MCGEKRNGVSPVGAEEILAMLQQHGSAVPAHPWQHVHIGHLQVLLFNDQGQEVYRVGIGILFKGDGERQGFFCTQGTRHHDNSMINSVARCMGINVFIDGSSRMCKEALQFDA
jgi:hypothetical protein